MKVKGTRLHFEVCPLWCQHHHYHDVKILFYDSCETHLIVVTECTLWFMQLKSHWLHLNFLHNVFSNLHSTLVTIVWMFSNQVHFECSPLCVFKPSALWINQLQLDKGSQGSKSSCLLASCLMIHISTI